MLLDNQPGFSLEKQPEILSTHRDVQRAIWERLDDNYSESGWDPVGAEGSYILAMAADARTTVICICPERGENCSDPFPLE